MVVITVLIDVVGSPWLRYTRDKDRWHTTDTSEGLNVLPSCNYGADSSPSPLIPPVPFKYLIVELYKHCDI